MISEKGFSKDKVEDFGRSFIHIFQCDLADILSIYDKVSAKSHSNLLYTARTKMSAFSVRAKPAKAGAQKPWALQT